VILPYSRAQIFTKGWGGKFQAHHALEVAMARDTLHMDEKAIANIPAIILTEAEHKAFTKALAEARAKFLEKQAQRFRNRTSCGRFTKRCTRASRLG
jgi:N-formylglutamate amidohydrolase